jgi:hypothetical protein
MRNFMSLGQIVNVIREMGSCKHYMFFKCITITYYHSCCGHFVKYKGRSLLKKEKEIRGDRNLIALRGKKHLANFIFLLSEVY